MFGDTIKNLHCAFINLKWRLFKDVWIPEINKDEKTVKFSETKNI